jgi:hypothetical protein
MGQNMTKNVFAPGIWSFGLRPTFEGLGFRPAESGSELTETIENTLHHQLATPSAWSLGEDPPQDKLEGQKAESIYLCRYYVLVAQRPPE